MDERVFFMVSGEPVGKGRPRFTTRGGFARTYTDKATRTAEEHVVDAWREAGAERIDGLVEVKLIFCPCRPKAHYLKGGGLSAAGQRSIFPARKPDIDNLIKLVLDALNGNAYADDVQVCHLIALRRWAEPDDAHTTVFIRGIA